MSPTRLRFLACLLAIPLAVPSPSAAFDTPLSDTAVREAYFLGQRHDETVARFFDKYTKRLPPPSAGPYISSITFLTPFALLVEYFSRQSNYSAQQAQIDHRADEEMVSIRVEIQLTRSYGAFLTKPTGTRSDSPIGIQLRPSSFWRQVKFRFFDGKEEITTDNLAGQPHFLCSENGCILTGATVRIEFPSSAFTSESARIEICPPEGDRVLVDFDLLSMR
ncbi:MAG TPA: hypothetical protein VEI54_07555 [Candidatus Limnocylindrales bacterium]|nr:hypothetical protein [Candidatus Limnocylindrales bacterium]